MGVRVSNRSHKEVKRMRLSPHPSICCLRQRVCEYTTSNWPSWYSKYSFYTQSCGTIWILSKLFSYNDGVWTLIVIRSNQSLGYSDYQCHNFSNESNYIAIPQWQTHQNLTHLSCQTQHSSWIGDWECQQRYHLSPTDFSFPSTPICKNNFVNKEIIVMYHTTITIFTNYPKPSLSINNAHSLDECAKLTKM